MKTPLSLLAIIPWISLPAAASTAFRQPNAAKILQDLERLSVVGNVLYVAAHPDDENTRLLAYLGNEKHLRAAYLSVTRGDGGQNLIGAEQGPLLGLIRTQELLAARAIDGAEQFFTRARDFGYSKTPKETLEIWGKDEVLADMVWVIRRFKPDVIITRFPVEEAETHGHHTASAMLAVEAFRAAADPTFHPEQLKHVSVWQAKRVVWNRFFFGGPPKEPDAEGFKVDVGVYNSVLGTSYPEMAAQSRSMHKSQGFGLSASRGPAFEYFRNLQGTRPSQGLFDGVDLTWARVPGSKKLGDLLVRAKQQYQVESPHSIIPVLLEARAELQAMPDHPWKESKDQELVDLILSCAGVWAEAYASDFATAPGGEIKVTASAINRSPTAIELREVQFIPGPKVEVRYSLPLNQPQLVEKTFSIPESAELSNPYWLSQPPEKGKYPAPDPTLIGLPEQPAPIRAEFLFSFGPRTLRISRPVAYKWTDPVAGERYRPVEISPPVMINPSSSVLMFPDRQARGLRILLKAGMADATGVLRSELSGGWTAEPAELPFTLKKKGEEQELQIRLHPPASLSRSNPTTSTLRLVAEIQGRKVSKGFRQIEYPHIPIQTLFPESTVKLVRLDLKKNKSKIAYIAGAGDEVPEALRQVGYEVTLLDDAALRTQPLAPFEAIVVGVRAYNVNERMPFYHRKLMKYVSDGGTMVVQYNTNNWISRIPVEIGPYPFQISRDRVTDEDAPATFEVPDHPLLIRPNKLTEVDFAGWVQERGLYFASKWDERYQTVLSMHDPNEPPKRGGLLAVRYGKGAFVYTGLAFFRQLPAGVPGAYRLFANLIAYGG
jgi:LmbE family N-acetylglucosaminyl deacetylase